MKSLILVLFLPVLSIAQSYLDGKSPYVTQMHIHGWSNHNGSPKPGSLQYHNWQADSIGIDVLWWSEHHVLFVQDSLSFNFHNASVNLSTLNLQTKWVEGSSVNHWGCINRQGSPSASFNSDTLHLSLTADSNPGNKFSYSPRSSKGLIKDVEFCKPIVSDPVFQFQIRPGITDAINSRIEVVFRLAWHFRSEERQDVIIYRLVHSSLPPSVSSNGVDTVVVVMPVSNSWQQVEFDLEDAASLLDHGRDNTISDIEISLVAGSGANVQGWFHELVMIPHHMETDTIVSEFKVFAEDYSDSYHLQNILGVEYSGKQHLNGYFPKTVSNRELFEGTMSNNPPGWVDSVHIHHGLVSFNHMFGVNWSLYSNTVQEYRSDTMALYLLANRAFGADILEVGFYERGGSDMARHLSTWDKLTANGLFLYGNGVSDAHGDKWMSRNRLFHTFIWSEDDSDLSLLEALSRGKMYFGNQSLFKGELYFTLGNLEMGDRGTINMSHAKPLIHLSEYPAGSEIKITQVLLDSTGTELNYLYNEAVFKADSLPELMLDRPSFVRFGVYDSTGAPVVFSQPIVVLNYVPVVDELSDVRACDSYVLQTLTNGNYFTGPAGSGSALFAGDTLTSSQSLYVYASNGAVPALTDESSFSVTINASPDPPVPSDVSACNLYVLPALTLGNYFTQSGGTGTALSEGDTLTSTQGIYVYAETGSSPVCTGENSFTVNLVSPLVADSPATVLACDSYILPALTVGNYFTGPGGTGTALFAGALIDTTQTIYVYAANLCGSDENSLQVNVNPGTKITSTTGGELINTSAPVALHATASAGTINWYANPVGGIPLATGPDYSPVVSATTSYYVDATDSTCSVSTRTAVVATVYRTQLDPAICNTTMSDYSIPVTANPVPGATSYRFRIQNLTSGYLKKITVPTPQLPQDWISDLTYDRNYRITVSAKKNGIWSRYGTACLLKTPNQLVSLQSASCNITLDVINQALSCNPIAIATNYKYQVENTGLGYFSEFIKGSADTQFKITALEGILFGTTYSVKVSYYYNGIWSPYGPVCTLTTPPTEPKLRTADCGINLTSMNQDIHANLVAGATNYRFLVENTVLCFTKTLTTGSTSGIFRMSNISGILANTTYTVKVAYYKNGLWSVYGSVCNVTTPPAPAAMHHSGGTVDAANGLAEEIYLDAEPNPGSGIFTISSSHEVMCTITNELGQVIQTVELKKGTGLSAEIEIREHGIYFISGLINNEMVSRKVMVIK